MAWDDDAEAGISKAEMAAGTQLKRTVVAPTIRAVVVPIEEKAKDFWTWLWDGLLHGIGMALEEIGELFGWESWVKVGQQLESIGRDLGKATSHTVTPSALDTGTAPPVPGMDRPAPNAVAPRTPAGTGSSPTSLLNKVESLGSGVGHRIATHWQFYGLLLAAHSLPKVRTPLLWLEDKLILMPARWVVGEIADPLLRKMGFVGFKDAARIEAVKDTIPVTFADKHGPTVEREIVLKPAKPGAFTRIKKLFPPTAKTTSEERLREALDGNAAATNENAAVVPNLTPKVTAGDVGAVVDKLDDPDSQPPLSAAATPNGPDKPQPPAAIGLNDAPLQPGVLAANKLSSHGIAYEPNPRPNDIETGAERIGIPSIEEDNGLWSTSSQLTKSGVYLDERVTPMESIKSLSASRTPAVTPGAEAKLSPTMPAGGKPRAGNSEVDSSGVVADRALVAEPKNSGLEPGSHATGTLMGAGIALQAAGTLLDPDASHLSTGDKAALVIQTAAGTGQAALEFAGPSFTNTTGGSTHWTGVGNDITGDLTGIGRSVGGLGVFGGTLGLYSSVSGLKTSIESGNTTGIVLNSGNALSSTAFTVAGIAQVAGNAGLAADSTGVGVIIGVPIQVVSLGFQIADYRNQSQAIDGAMKSLEADEAARSNGRITGSYSDIPGLPLPPSPDEYLGLSSLLHDKGDGSLLAADPDYYAKDPSKMEKLARLYGDQYDKAKALRQDVLSNLASGGALEQAIEDRFTDNKELNAGTLRKLEKQINLATAGRAALQELGWGPPDGSHPAGYAWRMKAYQDTVQALQQNLNSRHIAAKAGDYYQDRWAQLGRLAVFYKAIGSQRTVGQIEDTLGIKTSNDPVAVQQRAALEKIKANGDAAVEQTRDEVRRQRSDELTKADNELSAAQARLKEIPFHIRSGRGGITINPAYTTVQRATLLQQQKVDQIHSEIQQKVDEQAAKVQMGLSMYFANELARRNAVEEQNRIKGMKTEQERDAYFQKNADFIAKAGLQDRQDLICVGFSTSRDEINRKAGLLGLAGLEPPSATTAVTNTAQAQAVAAIKSVITEIKAAVLSPAEVFEKFRNAMGKNNGIAQATTPSSAPLTPRVGSKTDTGGASDTSKHLP